MRVLGMQACGVPGGVERSKSLRRGPSRFRPRRPVVLGECPRTALRGFLGAAGRVRRPRRSDWTTNGLDDRSRSQKHMSCSELRCSGTLTEPYILCFILKRLASVRPRNMEAQDQ